MVLFTCKGGDNLLEVERTNEYLMPLADLIIGQVEVSGRKDIKIKIAGKSYALSECTISHSMSVARISGKMGEKLMYKDTSLCDIVVAGFLHDIGKLFISDKIIDKRGLLTEKEREIVKQHSKFGADFVKKHITENEDVLLGILHHHERLDGSGYPKGLKDSEISRVGKIIAVADVYDALTQERPYRNKSSKEDTIKYINAHSGSKFDTEIVSALIECMKEGL